MDFRKASIDQRDAKDSFDALMQRVAAGHEVAITRRGGEVARLVPAKVTRRPVTKTRKPGSKGGKTKTSSSTPRETALAERKAAAKSILRLGKGLSLGGLKIKNLLNEGRR